MLTYCVLLTVVTFGLNRYIAQKTLNSSVINFFVNFMMSSFQQPNTGGVIIMTFWTGLGWKSQTKSIAIVNISILLKHMCILFLTKHYIVVFLASAKTVDTGISCAYLRLLKWCYLKTFWARKRLCSPCFIQTRTWYKVDPLLN